MSGPEELRRRVVELEAQAGFQERTIAHLDEVVREFTLRIEALEAEVRLLRGRVEAATAPTDED